MTTAHRATWNPAVGGSDQGGNKLMVPSRQYSSKDLPGYTVMKERKPGQGSLKERDQLDFKDKLVEEEYKAQVEKNKDKNQAPDLNLPSITQAKRNYRKILKIGASEGVGVAPGDEDDEDFLDGSDESDDDSSDDDDDDEETALLLEYERIKREREEKEQKEKDEKFEKMTKDEQKEIINNNPLFDENYSLKKRWYEETVFRNQTKTEPKVKKRFINDTVRSDFHKNFLKKYIWT